MKKRGQWSDLNSPPTLKQEGGGILSKGKRTFLTQVRN